VTLCLLLTPALVALLFLVLALVGAAQPQSPEPSLAEAVADVREDGNGAGYAHQEQEFDPGQDAQTTSIAPVADGDGPVSTGRTGTQEAYAILRKLKPYPRRSTRFSKPSGVLSSSVYYANKLFTLLFMNGPSSTESHNSDPNGRQLEEPLATAKEILQTAAIDGDSDALLTLAEMNFYGKYSHPRNYADATKWYRWLAASGNSTGQRMMGFIYATGLGDVVDKDQAQALLYHTFAAEGGDTQSQMTVAFRHHSGIGTPRNCEGAVKYYKMVADKAIEFVRSGPPGGRHLPKDAFRLADEVGGVYGEGASVSSSGHNAKHGGPTTDTHAALEDVLEYLDLMSRKGELKATFGLGRLHYEGSRELRQDFHSAKDYFLDVARKYWAKDGSVKADVEPGVDRLASKAAGYLGQMFLRGEGMEQNFAKARVWFKRGIKNGDVMCQYSMGLMNLHGLDMPQHAVKAAEFFGAAADQDYAPAQVQLGALLMDQGDLGSAIRYFEFAARSNNIEALYYMGEVSNLGVERERSCNTAALYYKMVAEKAEPIHSSFREANEAYEDGDIETALVAYMMAAEQGYEAGQANVAYILDAPHSHSALSTFIPFLRRTSTSLVASASHTLDLALIYWTRSARQSNIDSMVKMGDYYLLGAGTPSGHADAERAETCYTAAAETQQSAQALWNLGWMHENGVGGVSQDFHLAKRFYDQALEINFEAYLPVTLALAKLRLRSWWNTLTHGSATSIHADEAGDGAEAKAGSKRYSWSEWFVNFLEADLERYARLDEQADEWDTGRLTAADHEQGLYGDEYYDIDDGMLETIVIVALAAALAFLVYLRQQRGLAERRRQAGEGAAGVAAPADEDRGLFPAPGEPGFADWAVGGVGH